MITVYTTPTCTQCSMTKKHLDQQNIAYTVIDVSTDIASLEYVRSLGYTAAPVVVAGNKHWSGFRPDLLATLGQD